MSWNYKKAIERIETAYDVVANPEIRNYTRSMDLNNIPPNAAYRMDAAHLYIDIRNMHDVVGTGTETEQRHKKMLRFIDLQHRAIRRILTEEDVVLEHFPLNYGHIRQRQSSSGTLSG